MKKIFFGLLSCGFLINGCGQKDPKTTEVWTPEPKMVTPASDPKGPPSDAVILFDGNNTNAWQHTKGGSANWTIANNILTVKEGSGDIQTIQKFGDCQLHIEWRTPAVVKGDGQDRGNSGVYLMGRYEVQILDNYNNKTYPNGQAASIYKQHIPLVNASRGPGEWQTYDIIFTAPRFAENGTLYEPARITVLHNGILVQNNVTIWGSTKYIGLPTYEKHATKEPIILQDHGNPTSFRNIWIREL